MIATITDPPFSTGLKPYAQTLPEHISPSAAKSYLACSLRFYFERVACIRKPTSIALHLGKSIHAALQAFHVARWRGGDDSPETIAEAFEKAFSGLERDEGPVRFKDDKEREKSRLDGLRVVAAYPHCVIYGPFNSKQCGEIPQPFGKTYDGSIHRTERFQMISHIIKRVSNALKVIGHGLRHRSLVIRIGNETANTSQEWKARPFHGGLNTRFDETKFLQGVAGDEALMAELDQTVRNVGGIQSEVFGTEFFTPAPVTNTSGHEDSPTAYRIKESGLRLVGIHDVVVGVGVQSCLRNRMARVTNTPAPKVNGTQKELKT